LANKPCHPSRILLFLIGMLSASASAAAPDFAFTGFATAGYAISDQDFRYLRYIDRDGTFKTDSLVGVQVEARFSPQWGATVQAVASAPRTRDEGVEGAIRWAFVSFRPESDWLFRGGRLRVPVFINSQNAEVGVTYDQARLPMEVYSLSPVYDVDGAAVTKTWTLDNAELNLDAYWGKSDVKFRLPFQRDPGARRLPQLAGAIPPDQYFPENITFTGAVLSHTSGPFFLRGGLHKAIIKPSLPIAETAIPTAIPAPPPFGGTLWVAQNPQSKIDVYVLTLGADWQSGNWRITGEYGQRILNDTKLGVDSKSGYVTVARTSGKWTPYATYARLLSGRETRKLYENINATPVPLAVQGPPLFLPSNFHQIAADTIFVYDQHSTMLGAAYSFSATSKLKFEWMRTKVGIASALVDGDVHNKDFNVFTVTYSIVF
jgi:hypothetical protein